MIFGPKITLRLEYIVEKQGFEPYEQVEKLAITEYIVTEKEVPGEPILGLQIKENPNGHHTYRLYRVQDQLPILFVDDEPDRPPRAILFKIHWRDSFIDDGVTSSYIVSGQEQLSETIDEERNDIEWKYILKEKDGKYYLIHKVPDVAGNMNSCETIANQGVDCKRPKNDIERNKCRVHKCPRPKRSRRSFVPW